MRYWDYQHLYHNGKFLCLLETNKRTGETCVSFPSGHTKWRFSIPELRTMALGVFLYGQPPYALFDYLLELEGWANEWDRNKFRQEVEWAIQTIS